MSGGGQGAGGGVEKIPEGTGAGDARSGGTDARGAQNQNADAAGTADVGPQLCGPTGGGPHWVEEGGTVTAILKCATGRVALGDAFIFGTLPRGATYDVATATLTWKTSLDQAGVHLLPITVRPWNETGEIKIGVV